MFTFITSKFTQNDRFLLIIPVFPGQSRFYFSRSLHTLNELRRQQYRFLSGTNLFNSR